MKRLITDELVKWKNSQRRKPLIIRGARQVGKTYSIKEFGESNFEQIIVLDFEKTVSLRNIFSGDLDVHALIRQLEVASNQRIIPEKCLVFFDEVQLCPRALMSLRYFYEELPALHVVAAGSLLEFEWTRFRSQLDEYSLNSCIP